MTDQTEREKFEAHMSVSLSWPESDLADKTRNGEYRLCRLQEDWEIWQARAALDGGAVSQDVQLLVDNIEAALIAHDESVLADDEMPSIPVNCGELRQIVAALRALQQPSSERDLSLLKFAADRYWASNGFAQPESILTAFLASRQKP